MALFALSLAYTLSPTNSLCSRILPLSHAHARAHPHAHARTHPHMHTHSHSLSFSTLKNFISAKLIFPDSTINYFKHCVSDLSPGGVKSLI